MYSSSLAAVSTLSDPFFGLALAIDLGKHAKQGRGDSSHLYYIYILTYIQRLRKMGRVTSWFFSPKNEAGYQGFQVTWR